MEKTDCGTRETLSREDGWVVAGWSNDGGEDREDNDREDINDIERATALENAE